MPHRRHPLAVLAKALELLRSELDSKEANGATKADDTGAPNIHERWENAGLIGCAKGLPSDLSMDPKYMEDFGRSRRAARS